MAADSICPSSQLQMIVYPKGLQKVGPLYPKQNFGYYLGNLSFMDISLANTLPSGYHFSAHAPIGFSYAPHK